MMKFIPNEKGSATILMVMIASVLLTIALGFNWLVKEHIQAAEGLKNKVEAILKARSALDTLIYLLLNGQYSWQEIILVGNTDITKINTLPIDGRPIQFTEDVRIRIQDSNGMLSLVSLDTLSLGRLIKNIKNLDNAIPQINSLWDWIDEDDLSRIDGAEDSYYHFQGLPYVPRNFSLQYKEELRLIKGFDKDLYDRIKSMLTMLPSTGFNPNTAGDEVLKAVLNINEDSLKMLMDFRSNMPIASNSQLFPLTGRRLYSEGDFSPSPFMEVTVEAGAPRVIYRIRAGLSLLQNEYAPYGVIFWHEE